MNSTTRTITYLLTALCLQPARVAAQDSVGVRGLTPPASLRASAVQTQSMINLVNSVEVLADSMVGPSAIDVRVLSTWGGFAGLPCDCLTTVLYIGLNDGGQTLRAYRLPELLDPKVDSMTAENDQPTIYVTYGLRSALRHARIVATLAGVHITQAKSR